MKIITGTVSDLKKRIEQGASFVNLDALKRGPASGHDLKFMADLATLLRGCDIKSTIKVYCPKYPYATTAENLYFYLLGTSSQTQEHILDVFNIPKKELFKPTIIKSKLLQLAVNFFVSVEQLCESYKIITTNESQRITGNVLPHEAISDALSRQFAGSVSLEDGLRTMGEIVINNYFLKLSNGHQFIYFDYTSELRNINSLPPDRNISTEKFLDHLETFNRSYFCLSRRLSDRVISARNFIRHHDLTRFEPYFLPKKEKDSRRYESLKKPSTETIKMINYNFVSSTKDLNYTELAEEIKVLLMGSSPVLQLKLIRSLMRKGSGLVYCGNGEVPYIRGLSVMKAAIDHCNKTGDMLINQHFTNRVEEVEALLGLYRTDLPLLQAPSNTDAMSQIENFVFGLNRLN